MYKFNNLFRNFNYFLKFYLTIFLAVSFICFDLLKFCLLTEEGPVSTFFIDKKAKFY